MNRSEIQFEVKLDDNRIPEKIDWRASEHNDGKKEETKAISISLWDQKLGSTLRIDLWTKDMPVNEMKQFYIDAIGGFAQSILNATGDEYMAKELKDTCTTLSEHLKKEIKSGKYS